MFVEVLQYHIEAIVDKHLTKLTVQNIYCLLFICLFGYLLFTVYMFVWCFVCAGQGLKWW